MNGFKAFFVTFIMVLILLVIFFFFGGFVLLDFKQHFWFAVLLLALAIALIVYGFLKLSIRVEELEKRLDEIEKKDA